MPSGLTNSGPKTKIIAYSKRGKPPKKLTETKTIIISNKPKIKMHAKPAYIKL